MSQETHYDVLSVKENASYDEIRSSYRSAILNHHPDKLQKTSDDNSDESDERFLRVQKAWEVLGNARLRAIYDSELQTAREDVLAADDLSLQDMVIEDGGDVLELFYQCRCADYFSVDSVELGKMGYTLLRDNNMISIQHSDALPSSVILPCGSCSLQVRLLIDADIRVPIDGSC